jgi:hypothetical protein
LTARFIISKLKEYNSIRGRLAERLISISKRGHNRILFIGPEIVKESIDSIICERALELVLVARCEDWQEIKNYNPESFDIALNFNNNQESKPGGISSDRIISFW